MGGKVPKPVHHDWIKDVSNGRFDPSQHEPAAAAPDDQTPAPALTGAAPADPMQTGSDAPQPLANDAAQLSGGAPPAAGAAAVWNAPFDLGACDNVADACMHLVDIQAKLQEWTTTGYDAEMSVVSGAVANQLKAISVASRPLTTGEAASLTAVGLLAVQAMRDALTKLVAAISAELDKYSGVEAQAALDAAAELLHQEFRKGDGSNKIADLKALIGKAGAMAGDIKKYVGYAQQTKSVVKAAAKLEDVSKGLEAFKSKMESAEKTLDLASDVATIAGKVGEKPSGTANDINKLKAGLAIVDFVISKSNVPVIGAWWTNYIKPCAEMAMDKLQKLDDMIDKATRSNVADEWWQQASKGMGPPSITDSGLNGALLAKVFPAGQPMLDFLWSFFRGAPPSSAPDAVAKEFLKFRKQFNAGLPEADQLQTDAAWYNAWDALGKEGSPNLMSFVANNKEYIWAAEYGALPHP